MFIVFVFDVWASLPTIYMSAYIYLTEKYMASKLKHFAVTFGYTDKHNQPPTSSCLYRLFHPTVFFNKLKFLIFKFYLIFTLCRTDVADCCLKMWSPRIPQDLQQSVISNQDGAPTYSGRRVRNFTCNTTFSTISAGFTVSESLGWTWRGGGIRVSPTEKFEKYNRK